MFLWRSSWEMSELEKTQAGQEASANGATADEAQAAAQAQRESVVMARQIQCPDVLGKADAARVWARGACHTA